LGENSSIGRVKHMNIVNHALGYIHKLDSFQGREDHVEQLEKALTCFKKAFQTDPNNKFALRNYAYTMFAYIGTLSDPRSKDIPLSLTHRVEIARRHFE